MTVLRRLLCAAPTLFFIGVSSVFGADYTVKADGSGAFRTIQACADAARAGDSCVVYPGIYAEYVTVSNSGTATSPITLSAVSPANAANTSASQRSTVKGFRIKGANVTITGFDITKYDVGANFGHITVDATGGNCRVTNNVIRDGIWSTSSKYYFDAAAHTITNPNGGFIAAGFVPGVKVYVGSDINSQILNHDTIKTVTAVTDTTLTVTDIDTGVANWHMATEGPVQSTIYVTRSDKNGVSGIYFARTSGSAAGGCILSNNRLSNLAGAGILTIVGSNTLVEKNIVENMHGWRIITLGGSNNTFRNNVFKDSPRWAGFSAPQPGVYHSPGTGTWDMYASFLYSTATEALPTRDNLFEFNFVKNIDNSLAQVEYLGSTPYGSGLTIRNNVFVGVDSTASLHYPQTQVTHNTFVNSSRRSAHNFILQDSIHGTPAGSLVKNNVFVGNGSSPTDNMGWYDVQASDLASPADYDFVAGPASLGYPAKAGFVGLESHGINGGNPQFQNINDPFGPDGVAFTADDGLKPLATSPLCNRADDGQAIGAYTCAVQNPLTSSAVASSTAATSGASYVVKSDGTGNYSSIQACANAAKPGDTCLIQAGTYAEHVNTATAGTDDQHRITFRASGKVIMQGFTIKHPYVTVDGFDITGYSVRYQGAITVTAPGNYCQILNNTIHDLNQSISGIALLTSNSQAASNCVVRRNTLSNINYPMLNVNGNNHLFEYNDLSVNNSQDFVRLFGSGSTFRRNVFHNGTIVSNSGQHPDFVQTFGDPNNQSQNHLFEENWIENLPGVQLGQLNSGDGVVAKGRLYDNVRNIVFRRNIIVDVPANANVGMPEVRFENNTFYRMASGASGIIIGGSLTRGAPTQGVVVNNVFLNGGTGASGSGYYSMSGAVYSREVIGVLVTGEGVCQSTCAITPGIFADLRASGYIDANGRILSPALGITDISQLRLASDYSAYKQKVYDTLIATVQMDKNIRNTFYADYNYVYPAKPSGACEQGRYYVNQKWCEQHGINGIDGQFANLSNLMGPDGLPFTLDDGLKPAPTSPLCGKGVAGVDIGAYSCSATTVMSQPK